jgi:uncharacterized iron-regulated membrane protein
MASHTNPVSAGISGAACDSARLARLKARRKLWLHVHLWLGLVAGTVLAVIGLTGSLLVFWYEISASLNPELFAVQPPANATRRSMDEIVAAAKAAFPPPTQPGGLQYPTEPDAAVMFFGWDPSKPYSQTNLYNAFVDPYTAKAKGTRIVYDLSNPLNHSFDGFLFKLHYALLLGDTAKTAVGILGMFMIISVLTGLIVWWPLTGRWKQALTIKRGSGKERLNFDLHKISGAYTAVIMLAVLFSGVYLNLPGAIVTLVRVFSPETRTEPLLSAPVPGRTPITANEALARANARYPGGRLVNMGLPQHPTDVYRVCHQDVPELAGSIIAERCLTIDQYSGEILDVKDTAHGTGGDIFLQWQWHLHSGRAFGTTGRILVFLTGLACPVLYITGVIRWLQKRRARQFKKPAQDRSSDGATSRVTGRSH